MLSAVSEIVVISVVTNFVMWLFFFFFFLPYSQSFVSNGPQQQLADYS